MLRSEISVDLSIPLDKWNKKAGRAIGSKENGKSFNDDLEQFRFKVFEAHQFLSLRGINVTAEAIKNKLSGKAEKSHTLIDVFKDPNAKMAALVGK